MEIKGNEAVDKSSKKATNMSQPDYLMLAAA